MTILCSRAAQAATVTGAMLCLVFSAGLLGIVGASAAAADGGASANLRPRRSTPDAVGSPGAATDPASDNYAAPARAPEATTSTSSKLPRNESTPLALAPPRLPVETDRSQRGLPSLATLLGGLAVVIGLFLLAAWLLRLGLPKGAPTLPREAWEILGRAPLAGRQHVQLVRCGGKMLLLSVTPTGAETLTEITDPAEVDRLAGICQQSRPNSATASFRQMLDGFAREPQLTARHSRDFDRTRLSGEDASLG